MLQSTSENFPAIFGIFGVFFVPCKHFVEFPEFVFALKKYCEKTNTIHSYRAES
jgi:hypothetical protein